MASYTVKTGGETNSTGSSNGRSLARTSDGVLWCVYKRSDGTYDQIYAAYSTDGGQTWTEEQVCSGSDTQGYASIAIDSSNNIHVVWYGKGWGTNTDYENIQYRMRNATGWQPQESVTDVAHYQYDPSIAVDSADNVHVVWHGQGWGSNTGYYNIQYRKRTTSWQTQEGVTDTGNDQYDASIAMDSADNIHVVWTGKGWGTNTSNYNIQYNYRTTAWQTQEGVTDKDADQWDPSIAIDSADTIHVVWRGEGWGTNTSYYNIQYNYRTTAWQTQVGLTDVAYDQKSPSIAIDSADNIHVVWTGKGWGTNTSYYNLQYRERTTAWQTQVGLTDVAADQNFPKLIWALDPILSWAHTNRTKTGYAFVWVDDTTVKYYKSSDLNWDVASNALFFAANF